MGYSAVSLGLSEAKLNIFKILGEYALNDPDPKVLVANLSNKETEFPEQVFETALVQAKGSTIKVGVTAVVGPTVSKAMKDSIAQFGSSKDALTKALKSFAEQKTDLKVLLYQGAMGTVANDDSEPIAAARPSPLSMSSSACVMRMNPERTAGGQTRQWPYDADHPDGSQGKICGHLGCVENADGPGVQIPPSRPWGTVAHAGGWHCGASGSRINGTVW